MKKVFFSILTIIIIFSFSLTASTRLIVEADDISVEVIAPENVDVDPTIPELDQPAPPADDAYVDSSAETDTRNIDLAVASESLEDFVAMVLMILILAVPPLYVYTSVVYMQLAKKMGVAHAWLAWVPIANLYLISKMAGMHWWPMLLIFLGIIPFAGALALITLAVYLFFWHCHIFERVNRPTWWALTSIMPGIGMIVFLVLLGLAAWPNLSGEISSKPR